MKAITKDNRIFDVRFKKLNITDFTWFAEEKRWWGKSAEINIDGAWYSATVEATYKDGVEKACCALSKSACKALNVEPVDNSKRIAIWLDAIKEFGVYWDDEFLDECDMFFSAPGWRFTYHAIDRLRELNHRVFVDYVEVTD